MNSKIPIKTPLPLYKVPPVWAPTDEIVPQTARRVYIETYGCQMNVSDSELMAGILTRSGYEMVDQLESADVVLVNTCAIRENAEEKVLNRLKHLNHRKRRQPNLVLGVCGCMAQHIKTKILDAAPYVDLVMGPDSYRGLPRAIQSVTTGDPFLGLKLDKSEDYADIAPIRKEGVRAWLTIQRGCDKMCTFCIVPFVRGRERSIPMHLLIDDMKRLVDEGFKEVVLLGQTVNSYHDGEKSPLYPPFAKGGRGDFGDLLVAMNEVEGLERIRFTSPHPSDATKPLIEAMASCDKVCKQIHLPLQSGSTKVLQAMRRTYTAEAYRELVARMRERIPNLAISTDVIVGFCGETEEDFMETYHLMAEIRYDSAFMFKYSAREGTLAYKTLNDDVSEEEKGRRLRAIIELQEQISHEINQGLIGETVEVLVEGESRRDAEHYHGKTDSFKTTVFPKGDSKIGELVRVKVESATAHTLLGEIA
ncbi:tRNA (N6-isopentenyl adenosine(37)-C2)-methylthiotransferase MiaB [Candidatus Poribacteria bacterium]|nr:tRNA (N6-isopentenyl adenosine(37)-C2)-methylthiotransferase MiaB [Candidatus Poribacteria bacterium]